jgi:hypothetical protein
LVVALGNQGQPNKTGERQLGLIDASGSKADEPVCPLAVSMTNNTERKAGLLPALAEEQPP